MSSKRAVLDRVTTLAASDPTLGAMGVEVSYAWVGGAARRAVYFGATHFVRQAAAAEAGVLDLETDQVTLYVRAADEGSDVQAAEDDIETIADTIVGDLYATPQLAGNLSFLRLTAGDLDYAYQPAPAASVRVVLRLIITVEGLV